MSQNPRALVFVPGQGALHGAVDVYRDGEGVVVVGDGGFVKMTPRGRVECTGTFQVRFETVAAYNWAKERAFERDPVKYTKLVGMLGVDDDATNAPELPEHVEVVTRNLEGDLEAGRVERFEQKTWLLPLPAPKNVAKVA
jgi:hypothetical protein